MTGAPVIDLVSAAARIALKRPGEADAADYRKLRWAADALGDVGAEAASDRLLLAAADCFAMNGPVVETHAALKAALKVWTTFATMVADPGTPEADPDFWWKREAGGMG